MESTGTKSSMNAGVRERLRSRQGLVIVAVLALSAYAVWTLVQQAHSGPPDQSTSYYSVDDGQSYFSDSASKLPPYDYGGKQAVRAHVFDCDGDHYVAYLTRYTADAIAVMQKTMELEKQDPNHAPATLGASRAALNSVEYKIPGDAKWTRVRPKLTRKRKDGSEPFEIMPWGPINPLDAP